MNRDLASAVTGFLSLPTSERAQGFRRFSARQWRTSMHWLVTSGLPLYLFDGLRRLSQTDVIPDSLRETLEEMWSASDVRVQSLRSTLIDLNQRFSATGLPYVNWKGFATIPDFCSDARFRAFSDFDFLVGEGDLPVFEDVLTATGYRETHRTPGEVRFETVPGKHTPFAKTYHHDPSRRVELHIGMNGSIASCAFGLDAGFLRRRTVRDIDGIPFPVLSPSEAFFLHAVHAVRHLLEGWTRPAWLLELRRFATRHGDDKKLWEQVRAHAQSIPGGAILVGIAAWLASDLFAFDTGKSLGWAVQSLAPRIVAWLECFGRASALAEFPGTKLPLMLIRELGEERDWAAFERGKLLPVKKIQKVTRPLDSSVRQRAIATKWQMKYVWTRLRFHARESARYTIEKRRWNRVLNALSPQETSLIP